jgi:hypothetical protein
VHPILFETHLRKATGVRHEQNLLRRGMDVVVVRELSHRQELIPVILFVACEDTDKLFKLLVDALGLAIDLGMVSGQGSRLDANEAPQFLGEFHDELRAVVRDVPLGGSVVPPYVLVVQLDGSHSTEAGVALIEVGLLTEDINHNHDRVESMWQGWLGPSVMVRS